MGLFIDRMDWNYVKVKGQGRHVCCSMLWVLVGGEVGWLKPSVGLSWFVVDGLQQLSAADQWVFLWILHGPQSPRPHGDWTPVRPHKVSYKVSYAVSWCSCSLTVFISSFCKSSAVPVCLSVCRCCCVCVCVCVDVGWRLTMVSSGPSQVPFSSSHWYAGYIHTLYRPPYRNAARPSAFH